MKVCPLLAFALVAVACAPSSVRAGTDLAAVIEAADPHSTIRLQRGIYEGPLIIDKPLVLEGEPGTRIVGADGLPVLLIVDTEQVSVRGLTLVGGRSGIEVRDSTGVLLDELTVEGPALHGVFAHDAEIHLTRCRVSGVRDPLGQGVEITNSDTRLPSTVTGCVILGPVFEGLVSHVSRVSFTDNEVVGSNERGITITEMSRGAMEGNTVRDVAGAAYFCGDMSRCSVVDNAAFGVVSREDGWRSSAGHGLVVHFYSEAFVDQLRVEGAEGDDVLVMLGSTIATEFIDP